MQNKNPKLVVALDIEEPDQAFKLARKLSEYPIILKVGWVLFPLIGHDGISQLSNVMNGRIFLDFKLHDIPSVIAKSVSSLMKTVNFRIMTLHASGGKDMMSQSADSCRATFEKGCKCDVRPYLLGVTVLTSFSDSNMAECGSRFGNPTEAAAFLGQLAKDSNLDGVVSSVHEAKDLRKKFGDDFIILTPGIRPSGADTQDQSRVATPSDAKLAGSSYIVVGRPIIKAEHPEKVVEQILHELGS